MATADPSLTPGAAPSTRAPGRKPVGLPRQVDLVLVRPQHLEALRVFSLTQFDQMSTVVNAHGAA